MAIVNKHTETQVLVTAKEDLDVTINEIENITNECINKISDESKVVDDKVAESRAVLEEANTIVDEATIKVDELNTRVDEVKGFMESGEILTVTNINRKFKPLLGQYVFIMNSNKNGYRTESYDKSKIDKKLTTLKATGIDYIQLCIHIGFREDTRVLYYQTNLEIIDYTINKANEIGIPVLMIKIHEDYTLRQVKYMCGVGGIVTDTVNENLYNVTIQNQSINNFKAQMETMFTEIFTLLQNRVTYISVMNEWEFMWNRGNPSYTPDVQDADSSGETKIENTIYGANFPEWLIGIMNQAKGLGFKVGVSTAGLGMTGGFSSFFSVAKSVYNNCDVAFLNMYPPASGKGVYTSYYDCKQAWDLYFIHNMFLYMKNNFPQIEKIFITETGTTGQYKNLAFPGNPNLQDSDNLGKDEVLIMYMKAMLDSLGRYTREELFGVTWWYTNSFLDELSTTDTYGIKQNMIDLIKPYLGQGV